MKKRVSNRKKKAAPIKKKSKLRIKSKSVSKVRVKTGIANLDPLIQGGLKPTSITLVTGDAGSGKTIFAMQFLLEGLRKGEKCLYLTFEEKKEKLYDDMDSFNWDFEKYEAEKKLFYLEYSPEQVKSLIEEGGGTVDQLISKNKISRLVIDSVTSFSLLYQDELARKEAGLALFELINKWGCTAVLTAQAEAKKYELEGSSLEFEADSIILLYHFRQKGNRVRALEILKMRGTRHINKTMEVEISQKGFIIKSSRVIKVD
jgi:circadian clock protein KaiC